VGGEQVDLTQVETPKEPSTVTDLRDEVGNNNGADGVFTTVNVGTRQPPRPHRLG